MNTRTELPPDTPAETVLRELAANEAVNRMRRYIQHGQVTTYTHCQRVARLSCLWNRRLRLHADEAVLARGAMLHDFCLYDWHIPDPSHRLHGFRHPETAARNALRYGLAGPREAEIIRSHMWPLTVTRIPRSREAWIVCLADKWCSLIETLRMRRKSG